MVEKKGMSTPYQLRKIGLPASVEKVKNFYRITSNTTLIGRGQSVDVFLDSSIRKGLISRAHAQIIQKVNGVNGDCVHEIFDTSLNGTYVNDVRIKGSVILKEGDIVAFGHLRGSLIEPGTLAPQKETEFLFKFEKCLHPEIKDEMVDLTEKELNNNSSVFMSPKSPVGENGNSVIGLGHVSLPSNPTPEKKMKYSPSQGVDGECIDEKIYIDDDDEDIKDVVATVTAKIKSNGNTSDDGSFQVDLEDSKVNEVGSEQVLSSGAVKLVHPRNKVIPSSYVNNPLYANTDVTLNTSTELRHINKNGSIKNIKSKNKKVISEKVNGIIDTDESEIEIESESESEYLEESDSDSEKSEEIPDDSSDNEYIPKGKSAIKKKQIPTASVHLKASQQKVNIKPVAQSTIGRKKSNSFTHDKCDAFDCKIPSGNLKTVTWVQCDDCDAWYHVSCSGLSIADVKKKDSIFRCGCS